MRPRQKMFLLLLPFFLCAVLVLKALAAWPWADETESAGPLDRIWTWLSLGSSQAALREAEAAVRRRPADAEAHLILAMLCEEQGDLVRAGREYALGLPLAEDRPYLETALGRLALGRRKWREAIERFQTALALDPALGQASFGLAEALAESGDKRGAISTLRDLVKVSPAWPEAWLFLGDLLASGGERPDALADLYAQAVQANPYDLDLRLRLARSLARAGRPAEARKEYGIVLRLDPDNDEARKAVDS